MFSKGISYAVLARNEPYARGFWHLTLCTLLSSQGSDAPNFRPEGFRFGATCLTYPTAASLSNRVVRALRGEVHTLRTRPELKISLLRRSVTSGFQAHSLYKESMCLSKLRSGPT